MGNLAISCLNKTMWRTEEIRGPMLSLTISMPWGALLRTVVSVAQNSSSILRDASVHSQLDL